MDVNVANDFNQTGLIVRIYTWMHTNFAMPVDLGGTVGFQYYRVNYMSTKEKNNLNK